MDSAKVEIRRIVIAGIYVHSVRVMQDGGVMLKANFSSILEAKDLARAQALKLGVDVTYTDVSVATIGPSSGT